MGGMVEVAGALGPGIGGGIGALGGLRFLRWAIEFSFKRRDEREARLKERERALESRYDKRLAHLEQELHRTRRAVMLLINDTATNNPTNPVLQRVAELLGSDDPHLDSPFTDRRTPAQPDEACEGLLRELGSVPGTHRRRG